MQRRKWHICLIRPQGYVHSSVFEELAESLGYALVALGQFVSYAENQLDAGSRNIVLAPHFLHRDLVPQLNQMDIILYNFEQIPTHLNIWQGYENLLLRFPIWDYQEAHVHWLRERGNPRVRYVPYGYTPRLTRLPLEKTATDIDVLFIGSLTERRRVVLEQLSRAGVRVGHAFGIYGLRRDLLLARSRVVLNCHQFTEQDPLEEMRLLYAWANGKPVVAEVPDPSKVPSVFRGAAVWARYDGLVDACLGLLNDEEMVEQLVKEGYRVARERDYVNILRQVIFEEVD